MSDRYVNMRNLQFLLDEVFEIQQLQALERYADYDPEAIKLTIDAARQLADQHLYPSYRAMDREKAHFQDGKVLVHPGLREAIRALAEGGWVAAYFDYDHGGQQMPYTLLNVCQHIFYAANSNAAAYAFLTQAAANLIVHFGSDELQETYLPSMLNGRWQGTMALTEPQAGSSLSDLTASARLLDGERYAIKGQKIFISGGDHEAVDNVVHLLLARIEGAPAGVKGISLFVVPKYRPVDGKLLPNDVQTAGLYGKMGQKGYVAAHLMFGENDGCEGYLVGAPHHGLAYMFQMMNEARIATGNLANGVATAAYHASLQYAHERAQGRLPGEKDPTQPPIQIIEHADVRRMLLFQKAVTEGSLALLLQCSLYADLMAAGPAAEQGKYRLLLELLTPIAKSFPSEMGIQAVSAGMQVLGGAGYTDDFPLEQHYRDIRVNSIYEGTTTIHGLDLLGRKVMMEKGQAVKLFLQEIRETAARARQFEELISYADTLEEAARSLHQTTLHLLKQASERPPEYFLADATLYLELFGLTTVGWQWLQQGVVAQQALQASEAGPDRNFYQGKMICLQYFFAYELPKRLYLEHRLQSYDKLTVTLRSEWLD